ncbi:MAG: peptidase C14 caspase catalytic subunit p20 [Bacteroidetes bacterium]|nr:peptidase C14 caspase catalytic subunit p20 [Bacteroidota bacterium]
MSLMLALNILVLPPLLANCIKGDCNNGKGTFVFSSGAKYIGEFKDRKIHGMGILYFSNGNKYLGNWVNQRREGMGKMIFVNGDEYQGEFKKNKMEGSGIMKYADGSRYEGYWKNGNRHGQGTFCSANGEKHEGEWVEGDIEKPPSVTNDKEILRNCNATYCESGRGKFTYGDGSIFVGDFKEGEPEGSGIIYYINGDKYIGGWYLHAPHGKGRMYYANGRVMGAVWDYGQPVKELESEEDAFLKTPVSIDKNDEVKIWAVVVGVGRYSHMPVLKYSDDDAYQVYAFLKSPEGGALPDRQIRVLIDEDATREQIIKTLRETLLRADDNDVVLFYFSGHGLEGHFLPVDYDGFRNKLRHEEIKNILEESQAKHKLVLADACHSGSLLALRQSVEKSLRKYYAAFKETTGGTALLMSSKGEEYSLEDGGLRSGIFSHYLIRGLKGEADVDQDKIVSIQELYNFVYKKVRTYTGNVQTPTLTGTYDRNMPVAVIR